MEDIEDVLGPAGLSGGGAPPGLRLPLSTVAVKPKRRSSRVAQTPPQHEARIPGTQSDSEYMSGQLSAFGYAITEEPEGADLWLINTCTVKNPSQSAMTTLISKCKNANKPLVVAGCVPQGSQGLKELEGISIIGVQQIDRVVEVVEETLKGHEVRLLSRKTLPSLDLPKVQVIHVRKNKFIEILPINVGCLGACTYCKTKHARGHLGSYTIDSLVVRAKTVVSEGVREIWLSSEDTGAYGRDIGTNLPNLLNAIVAELPVDRSTMLRIGMTNPPFILEHLKEIAAVLCHPCVYSFLHVPVQSGSDAVLTAMNREYTVSEFRKVVDTLCELVPGMQIATDIICGFPGETDEDFAETVNLIKEYQLPQVHISQFYPRPGTPAARMKKVPSNDVKKRSRELTSVFESFSPYQGMEGKVERIWITEIATDGVHLVGHTKGYIQVLVIAPDSMLGTSADVKITSVGRWSVFGEVIEGSVVVGEAPKQTSAEPQKEHRQVQVEEAGCCAIDSCGTCACSKTAQHCGIEQCEYGPDVAQTSGGVNRQEAIQSTLVRRNVEGTTKASESSAAQSVGKAHQVKVVARSGVNVDTILWCVLALSFVATVALTVLLTSTISSKSS
ncbi:Threonylcarbamoyladenosine tRNA methylthiotransferase [Dichanthelium oligosanthes]|uniref:Threonylcarbamoyladenosine tRNA methylthiotransferase n=1 Tax=Dichanthelium oligosanthes TaxID=888268 RepID=A0A1E5VK98_9POAL|nr:Threonylcarbamoyladenosine tRNA methylthiotransferase [Dichanthelium oligosanthes]